MKKAVKVVMSVIGILFVAAAVFCSCVTYMALKEDDDMWLG